MTMLLDWGTPVGAKDMSGRLSLHAAAETGSASACALLGRRGVELERTDDAGRTAVQLAIGRGHMPAVKEMLRCRARVPENASAPGLAKVIKEVQMERRIESLKAQARDLPEVTHEALGEAEPGVWRCQREHMRLLTLREEQRAGQQLANFQERRESELEAAQRARVEREANLKTISDLRVEMS